MVQKKTSALLYKLLFALILKIVCYNTPYNFKNLTCEIDGLVLENSAKLTVRASAITRVS